jgi:hypothetical protein
MTNQQIFEFFRNNPNTDIIDEKGVHHSYAMWQKHRLDFLSNQELYWQDQLKRVDSSLVVHHYAEMELQKTCREIQRILRGRDIAGTIVVNAAPPRERRETFVETAWRAVKTAMGGNR